MTSSCVNIITSAAYVNQELAAEFGLIPPSFLPLGTGRLFEIQVKNFRKNLIENSPIYLTLPDSFIVTPYDQHTLKEKGVVIVSVPDDMSLGNSLVYTINVINAYNSNIRILHGDTILDDIPQEMDIIASYPDGDDYSWAVINQADDKYIKNLETIKSTKDENNYRPVACGYFSFSKGNELIKSLCQARGNFIEGINLYNKHQPLKIKAIKNWYDFGHIQTYFQSRRLVTTARAFNSLQITSNTVKKISSDSFKMLAEAEWLESTPPNLKPFTARLFEYGQDNDKTFYSTEYQYTPTLAELFVFSDIGKATWNKILASCTDFLNLCAKQKGKKKRDDYTAHLIGNKTFERLKLFSNQTGFNIMHDLVFNGNKYPSLLTIANNLSDFITKNPEELCTIMHGDFCFSNILYNSRNRRITVIDPRGYVFPHIKEKYGDLRYDMAKLSHSINGLYDFIITGRYNLINNNQYDFELKFDLSSSHKWLQTYFNKINIANITVSSKEIQAMTIALFLSMLPLHADRPDRQKAFIANALRLYSIFERKD